ncbi:MAG TPA: YafY family protein [Thermomicrobiales bacterium]|jgi:predicted DNA-binding transcriptional regulator YafY
MYHPTTRVLTTLELLQSRPRLSGPELAERLDVDPRTVRRYVAMLQDLGIPVEAERGRHGAYRLRPGFKLPPLMFTDDEALALTLGLLAARRLGLAVAAPAVEGALAKIERVLPPAVRDRVGAVQATLVTDLAPARAVPTSETLVTLSAGAQQGRRVRLRYRAWDGGETEREIDPYGVVFVTGRWFTVGYCHLRQNTRIFRLDRIQTADLRDQTFTRPADFDPLAYLEQTLPHAPGAWPVEVLLRTTLAEAKRLIPPTTATLDETPDGVLLRCVVQDLAWVARLLVSLDEPFVVHHPPELRDEIRQLAERTIARVNPPGGVA